MQVEQVWGRYSVVVRKGEELPVAYFSRQLHGAEVNYSSMELECLGVVSSQTLRSLSRRTKVCTDDRPPSSDWDEHIYKP